MLPYFWIAIMVLAAVTEAATMQLVAIWFLPAALVSTILAFAGVPWYVQTLVFVVVGLVLVLATRPLVRKFAGRRARTNADSLVGETGLVTEEIDNLAERGEVKLHGLRWSARTEHAGETIPVGTEVTVLEIQGVKLIVKTK